MSTSTGWMKLGTAGAATVLVLVSGSIAQLRSRGGVPAVAPPAAQPQPSAPAAPSPGSGLVKPPPQGPGTPFGGGDFGLPTNHPNHPSQWQRVRPSRLGGVRVTMPGANPGNLFDRQSPRGVIPGFQIPPNPPQTPDQPGRPIVVRPVTYVINGWPYGGYGGWGGWGGWGGYGYVNPPIYVGTRGGWPLSEYGWGGWGGWGSGVFSRSPFLYGSWPTYYNNDGSLYSPYQLVLPEPSWMQQPSTFVSTGTPQAAATAAPSAIERAEYLLKYGPAERAADAYREHLASTPNDHDAQRGLAMTLLEQGKTEEAIALLMMAYHNQPTLARQAIVEGMLPGGAMDHRRRFTRVMTYANRVKTSSSYFAACVLAQSEGRADIARKLLDKAVAAGLDEKVAGEMRVALPGR